MTAISYSKLLRPRTHRLCRRPSVPLYNPNDAATALFRRLAGSISETRTQSRSGSGLELSGAVASFWPRIESRIGAFFSAEILNTTAEIVFAFS
jgi:hypothetical protein